MNYADLIEWTDGSGTLDCVLSHGWLARLLRLRKFHAMICNSQSFKRGDKVLIFPALGDRIRGTVTVSNVRPGWFWMRWWIKPVLEFENELPAGTRKGDLLVTDAR